jgi:tetratricopeptide (TPR) repeat protein
MLRALDQLIELAPNHTDAYLNRGWIFERRFVYELALENYETAVAAAPRSFEARLRKAQVLLTMGRSAEALPIFEELRRERPTRPHVLLGLFQALLKLARTDEARSVDEDLARHAPKEVQILNERGRFYLSLGEADKAEAVLRTALVESPFDYHVHFTLHQALRHQNKLKEAEEVKAKVDTLAFDLNALHELTERLNAKPFDADLRCAIAQVFLRAGETREGLTWLKTVLRIAPRHGPTHRTLAEYYETNRQPALAEQHRKLAALAPSS